MKIGIIGATGNAGSVIFKEAQARGHEVTAIVRSADKATKMLGENINILEKNALELTQSDLNPFDAIINASALLPAYLNLDLATKLINLFRDNDKTQLIFIAGASSLVKEDGSLQITDMLKAFAGEPWIEIPTQQSYELQFLKWIDNVNWTVMIPQNEFTAGAKTNYRLGTNEIMLSKNNKSEVSFGNFAAAMLDEIEDPKHIRKQFTVVNN
ncbi:NADP oxidoreductase [Paucilactobacillus hokkaidonensis JCM 18461]|uniref:NADP oxidoreductase n=2 Tax=Paucilactobacillus hokkaidonensis TaxID=1193095 RepID=A0A0A1GU31_9LACO|nr:NAD(P)H-binding protein [Paucilactobacillus hokkaidonensis]KRO10313.1 NAD-dependent epimerase dehydratase [Paucilactobacillus hokkaidonensis]BAP85767.1 NADP oxidoreductase [Paucilactobacillus hokkaidonensis JCM 18461]